MKNKATKERRLKVTASFRRGKYKSSYVPQANLCGIWLAENGFHLGNELILEVSENQIIIRHSQDTDQKAA